MIIKPIGPQHYRVSQGFGENFMWKGKRMYGPGGWIPAWTGGHLGIDFTSRENQWGEVKPLPIRAGVDGKATMVEHTGKGNLVTIIGKNYMCEYMHLDSFEGGDREVKAGEIIGYTGNTGTYTTAAHLHLGVKLVKSGKVITTGENYGYIDFTDLLVDIPVKDFSQTRVWRGCKVRRVPLINNRDDINAAYSPIQDTIFLGPLFDTLNINHQEGILFHETGHRLWHKRLSEDEKRAWKEVSTLSFKVRVKLAVRGKVFMKNAWVNDYAKTKITEDFGECIEAYTMNPNKVYGNYLDIKIHVAMKLFNKYV